ECGQGVSTPSGGRFRADQGRRPRGPRRVLPGVTCRRTAVQRGEPARDGPATGGLSRRAFVPSPSVGPSSRPLQSWWTDPVDTPTSLHLAEGGRRAWNNNAPGRAAGRVAES